MGAQKKDECDVALQCWGAVLGAKQPHSGEPASGCCNQHSLRVACPWEGW